MNNWLSRVAVVAVLTQVLGCGNGDIIVPPAPKKTNKSEPVENVTPVVPKKPKNKRTFIRLDVPIVLENAGFLALIDVPDRGKVLKIKSNQNESIKTDPSYYFHAQVEVENLEELLGVDIEVIAFVRESKEKGTWTNATEKPVLIQIVRNKDLYDVKVIGGQMENATSGDVMDVTGEFVCVPSSK